MWLWNTVTLEVNAIWFHLECFLFKFFSFLGLTHSFFLISETGQEVRMEALFALTFYQKVLERTDSKWVIHSDPVGHSQARSFLMVTGSLCLSTEPSSWNPPSASSANTFEQMAFLRAVVNQARLLTLCEPSDALKTDQPEPSQWGETQHLGT